MSGEIMSGEVSTATLSAGDVFQACLNPYAQGAKERLETKFNDWTKDQKSGFHIQNILTGIARIAYGTSRIIAVLVHTVFQGLACLFNLVTGKKEGAELALKRLTMVGMVESVHGLFTVGRGIAQIIHMKGTFDANVKLDGEALKDMETLTIPETNRELVGITPKFLLPSSSQGEE